MLADTSCLVPARLLETRVGPGLSTSFPGSFTPAQVLTDPRLNVYSGSTVVATNDAHYLRKEDAEAHDVLLAIGTGKDLDDPNRFRFFGQESYVKSEREMRALFPDQPEVVEETQRVANLCEFDFAKRYFLPQYPRPAEFASDNDLLVHLARAGAAARYGDPLPQAVHGEIRIEVRQRVGTVHLAAVRLHGHVLAAAEDVGLRDRAGHHELVHRRETREGPALRFETAHHSFLARPFRFRQDDPNFLGRVTDE